MPVIAHVLAATDFSPAAAHALRSAANLSARLGAKLSVVHVVPPAPLFSYSGAPSEEAIENVRGRLEAEIASAAGERGNAILREGSPAVEVVRTARAIGADLVVVGSRGRRGARHALLGSVADDVARLSPVPVLTVHPWRFENRREAARALADATAHLRNAAPAVIAISREALVVAAEVGRSLGEAPDVLLARSVARDGVVIGGICEEGTARVDPVELARAPSDPERDRLLATAKEQLSDESTALRGSHWIGDVWHRTVVLVTDALEEPWAILAACDVLRRHGASPLIVAAPAATWVASAALEGAVDQLIALYTTDDARNGESFYRNARPVGLRAASRCLRAGAVSP
jgi:nucleotide-binding universal stress UspA family protein/predicted phosphoribosyltransferase